MTIRISGLAVALAIVLSGASLTGASAQEVGSGPAEATPDQMAQIVAQLLRQIQPFAEEYGIVGFDDEIRTVFQTYVPAALIVIPADKHDDPTFLWAGGLNFNAGYDVPADGVLGPDPEHPLYGDALECSRANGDHSVAHFRRIREGGMAGHVCTLGYQEEDKAILLTRTVVEGGGRRAWSNFTGFARVEGDPAAARNLLEPVIGGNVALAEAFDAVMIRNLPLAAPNRPAAAVPTQP